MASLRRLARMCRDLAKQHVDDPDVPAAPNGAGGYAEWTQIGLAVLTPQTAHSLVVPSGFTFSTYVPCRSALY